MEVMRKTVKMVKELTKMRILKIVLNREKLKVARCPSWTNLALVKTSSNSLQIRRRINPRILSNQPSHSNLIVRMMMNLKTIRPKIRKVNLRINLKIRTRKLKSIRKMRLMLTTISWKAFKSRMSTPQNKFLKRKRRCKSSHLPLVHVSRRLRQPCMVRTVMTSQRMRNFRWTRPPWLTSVWKNLNQWLSTRLGLENLKMSKTNW